ncbi:MAG TPA: class I SAM-dependent methyltransferase [Candidatus Paceibacterota bacterium]
MTQENVWEREYRNSKLLTKENKPQSDVVRFVKWLKKDLLALTSREQAGQKFDIENSQVLDLGSGTGRNSFYFAEMGAKVTGFEISKTAIEIANKNAEKSNLDIKYKKQSIGEEFILENGSIDIVLDVTSSNSLAESEREVYLSETSRVLKNGGYFFVKALCKNGDENAKFLLKNHPGKEKDTYVMPGLGVTERVWSKEDFVSTYEKYFKILHMEKKTSYSRMNDRSYKRNFWLVYLAKVD